jgi:hypothetical protein
MAGQGLQLLLGYCHPAQGKVNGGFPLDQVLVHSKTMFLCFSILCLWLRSSSFPQKVRLFLCFYFSEDVHVDMALDRYYGF